MSTVRGLEANNKPDLGNTGLSNTILRTRQIKPDQCLSCGNIEQNTLQAEGLKGMLYKTGERTHSRSGSPNRIEIFTPGM